MIRKSEIVDAINALSHDLTDLAIKISALQKDVTALKISNTKAKTVTTNCQFQPRDKSGRFTKK